MFRIGPHVSISGGYPKVVDRVIDMGGNCGQIFAGSPRGWKVTKPDDDQVKKFTRLKEEKDVGPWIIHGTYLINFATPKDGLAKKSVKTVQEELNVASELEIPFYVFHPGAHTGAGEKKGIENIADRLSELKIPEGLKLLLENTAGKGTTLGKDFEQLDRMVKLSNKNYSEIGVCLDSCHMFAAGYEIYNENKLDRIIKNLDEVVGLENVHYLHINDSKHSQESEKDEHQHVGEGEIGEEGLKLFINHESLREKPMVLETPVDEKGYEWNIAKCKELREN